MAEGESPRRFLVSFVLLSMYSRIELTSQCHLTYWADRTSRLAAILGEATSCEVALDIFTSAKARFPGTERTSSGVVIRTHAQLPAVLERTQRYVPLEHYPSTQRKGLLQTLLKWVAVGIDDAEFAVMLDFDMSALTQGVSPEAVAADWTAVFGLMRARGLRLLSARDHSSPINAGLMIIRPSAAIFAKGVELLGRARSSFNLTHGWDLCGRPRDVVPRSDPVWRSGGSNPLLLRNDWRFVGSSIDQGFFFHMLRVRHVLGDELPLLFAKAANASRVRHGGYCLLHFFSKPYTKLPAAPKCRTFLKPLWLGRLSSYLRDSSQAFEGAHDPALASGELRQRCAARWRDAMACVGKAQRLVMSAAKADAQRAQPSTDYWACTRLLRRRSRYDKRMHAPALDGMNMPHV
jgi:hypothetical protein